MAAQERLSGREVPDFPNSKVGTPLSSSCGSSRSFIGRPPSMRRSTSPAQFCACQHLCCHRCPPLRRCASSPPRPRTSYLWVASRTTSPARRWNNACCRWSRVSQALGICAACLPAAAAAEANRPPLACLVTTLPSQAPAGLAAPCTRSAATPARSANHSPQWPGLSPNPVHLPGPQALPLIPPRPASCPPRSLGSALPRPQAWKRLKCRAAGTPLTLSTTGALPSLSFTTQPALLPPSTPSPSPTSSESPLPTPRAPPPPRLLPSPPSRAVNHTSGPPMP